MAWNTSLTTFTDGGAPTAVQVNQYLENLEWLHAPARSIYEYTGTADFTTTSTTWGTLTGFSTALVTTGEKVLALFTGTLDNVDIDISCNGTRLCSTGTAGTGSLRADWTFKYENTHNLPVLYEGLAAGTYTFAVQWKASAGTGTVYAAYQPRFHVRVL